jgi:hypothetical protein
MKMTRLRAYIGTYSSEQREGLFIVEWDERSSPQLLRAIAGLSHPSFLALHPPVASSTLSTRSMTAR